MDRIWANRLEAGTKTWADVPEARKDNVKAILYADVEAGKLTPERYEEITGEPYIPINEEETEEVEE